MRRRERWVPVALSVIAGYGVSLGCFGSRSGADAPFAEGGGSGDEGGSGPVGAGGDDTPIPQPAVGVGGFDNTGGFGSGGDLEGGFGPGSGGSFGGFGGGGGFGTGGAGGATGPIIDCVNETCSSGEVCCHAINNPQNSSCGAPGSCSGPPIEISCENPSDCPGAICCGIFDFVGGQQGYEAVRCDATCDPPQADLTGIIMCGDDPSVCPGGPQDCLDSGSLPPGFNFCDPN